MLLVLGVVHAGWGQDKKRTYASFQGTYERGLGLLGAPTLVGQIIRPTHAANGNPQDSSTLTVPIGALNIVESTHFLEFTTNGQHSSVRNIPSNTAVSVKFSLPKEVLGLLSSVSIGTFTNLNPVSRDWSGALGLVGEGHNTGYNSTNRVEYYAGASLLNLLNGAGQFEITFTPTTNYQGVYLSLGSVLSLGLSADLFHAYILEEYSYSDCEEKNDAIDLLSGVRAGTVVGGIANATGFVNNPWNAIDSDETTYAEINTGAQLLSEIYHTTIFQTPSSPGDIVKLILQDPGASLLELDLLQGFTIQPFLRNMPVGTPITNASNLLSLKLLGGAGNKYTLSVPISGTFDRIEIKMGGVADALSVLRVYEVSRETGPPTFSGIELGEDGIPYYTTCLGSAVSLSIQDPIDGLIYQWFANSTGGSPVHTGPEYYIPAITNTTTYYVQAVYGSCSPSERIPVRVVVNPLPNASDIALFINKPCDGGTASFLIFPANSAYTYYWYDVATGGTALGTGTSFSTGPIAAGQTYTYYIEVEDNETGCKNVIRYPFIVDAYPPPQIAISSLAPICEGETIASITYTTTNNPTSYSITWQENPPNFSQVVDRPLPATGPIELIIPATAVPASYLGEIRVRTANGCISETVSFTLAIYPKTGKPHLTITDVQN